MPRACPAKNISRARGVMLDMYSLGSKGAAGVLGTGWVGGWVKAGSVALAGGLPVGVAGASVAVAVLWDGAVRAAVALAWAGDVRAGDAVACVGDARAGVALAAACGVPVCVAAAALSAAGLAVVGKLAAAIAVGAAAAISNVIATASSGTSRFTLSAGTQPMSP